MFFDKLLIEQKSLAFCKIFTKCEQKTKGKQKNYSAASYATFSRRLDNNLLKISHEQPAKSEQVGLKFVITCDTSLPEHNNEYSKPTYEIEASGFVALVRQPAAMWHFPRVFVTS